jgi:type IV secretion system protein TrbB
MPDASRVKAMLTEALGPVIVQALADPQTCEVMVNADGSIWHERHGAAAVCVGHQAPRQTAAVIRLLATINQRTITADQPSLDATMPTGERFKGFLPPRVQAPAFCIRVPQAQVLTRADYVPHACPAEVWDVFIQAIVRRDNILLVGAMSSGKTTLMNALSACYPPEVRMLTLEDACELSVQVPNHLQLYASGEAEMPMIVKEGFRTAAQRVLVGEIRDGLTALTTLKLWLAIGGGLCTTHAESAIDAMTRLAYMCAEVGGDAATYQPLIGDVVDLVVFLEHRQIAEVLRVQRWNGAQYATETVLERRSVGAARGRAGLG